MKITTKRFHDSIGYARRLNPIGSYVVASIGNRSGGPHEYRCQKQAFSNGDFDCQSKLRTALFFALLLFFAFPKVYADDAAALKFFENKVRPLLAENCFSCHGEEKQKGGLRLDHINFINKGGESEIAAVIAGNPADSQMIEAVKRLDEDTAMPPKEAEALSTTQIAVLEKWIAMGAPWPEGEVVAGGKVDKLGFSEEDYAWWAIQPVMDPAVPSVEYSMFSDQVVDKEWKVNPVDAFVLRKLKAAKLKPSAQASREELVRRAYFDLHGVPPTVAQTAAFVNDKRADAWMRLVDELLESPRYGERWASHWLDVVRYAESDGYRSDGFRPEVWKYRDYVIRSLNEDKPYDQFVREQLAADEFAADDPDTLIATAFLRLGVYEWNQRDAKMQWDLIMTEMTNVTSEAFLGLGMGCAQCHDHKFDPILQKDYFALRAFLNTTWWPEHEPIVTPAERAEYDQKLADWEAVTTEARAEMNELTKKSYESNRNAVVIMFPEDVQAIYNKPAAKRTPYEEQIAQLVQRQVDDKRRKIKFEKLWAKRPELLAQYTNLKTKLEVYDNLKPEPLPVGFISTDVGAHAATTFMKKRKGDRKPIEPAFLALLNLPAPKIVPTKKTTGRRLALANWIADEKNPLSTRVIVNRVWQRHFGRGIVKSPNEFGSLGGKPTHPELLDWLTKRFLDNGWKLKPLHRLIMTSAAYQQTARREPTTTEDVVDPENTLLWRFSPQRLQAEQIRDAMLMTSGEMKDFKGGASLDGKGLNRSIFIKKRRNTPDGFLGQFDTPIGFNSIPDRVPTTTALQSLLLVNGEWPTARARAFAKRILAGKIEADAEMVSSAFRMAYGRTATQPEIDGALTFIRTQLDFVPTAPTGPVKYPGETGLRPVKQKFGKVGAEFKLGEKALWLQPDSKFARLDFSKIKLPTEAFTIEVIADLDAIRGDASVNTLLGRWNGSRAQAGWALGVTNAKSGYQPRNFIMQLTGADFQGNVVYEVVASGLRFPLGKPVYLAASISAKPGKDDVMKGTVTFYMKELGNPAAKLQKKVVSHQIVGGLDAENVRSLIGSRDEKGHRWDGQLARLTISKGALAAKDLIVNGGGEGSAARVLNYDFSSENGEEPEAGTTWVRDDAAAKKEVVNAKLLGAVTDFCHALLTSNEFLYIH